MLTSVLSLLHQGSTLLFGILISAFFLGVKQNRTNMMYLLLVFAAEGIANMICNLYLGEITTSQIYPLIVHLPLILFLCLYYGYSLLASCVSVFTAYLCCQISNWLGLFVLAITKSENGYYFVRILTTVIVFVMLQKYVCHVTESVFAREKRDLLLIGGFPFVYYVYDYTVTKFSHLLYSDNKAVAEFMGFAFCLAYLIFLLIYFREAEKQQAFQRSTDIMEMQLLSQQKEIEQVKASQEAMTILRHDMRHQLNMILAQLQSGNVTAAMDYISQIENSVSEAALTNYCENEMLNAVLSIWQMRFEKHGLTLKYDISIRQVLTCPELELCTILSNSLENAMNALMKENAPEEKWVNLKMFQRDDRLMIQMENPCYHPPRFVDGIPISDKKEHGIGTRSMVHYVEKLHGQCNFSVQEHKFLLRIIL